MWLMSTFHIFRYIQFYFSRLNMVCDHDLFLLDYFIRHLSLWPGIPLKGTNQRPASSNARRRTAVQKPDNPAKSRTYGLLTSTIHRHSLFHKNFKARIHPSFTILKKGKDKDLLSFTFNEILFVEVSTIWPCHSQYCIFCDCLLIIFQRWVTLKLQLFVADSLQPYFYLSKIHISGHFVRQRFDVVPVSKKDCLRCGLEVGGWGVKGSIWQVHKV